MTDLNESDVLLELDRIGPGEWKLHTRWTGDDPPTHLIFYGPWNELVGLGKTWLEALGTAREWWQESAAERALHLEPA